MRLSRASGKVMRKGASKFELEAVVGNVVFEDQTLWFGRPDIA